MSPAPTAPIPAPETPVNSRLPCALVGDGVALNHHRVARAVELDALTVSAAPAEAPVEVAPDTVLLSMSHVPIVAATARRQGRSPA